MQHRDEFDTGPDFKAAINSIFNALDRKDRVKPHKPMWSIAVVLSLVLFLGSVLWYSYPKEAEKREVLAVPVIYADASPYKVVPNDPGGMDIPHRDSTVFDSLRADNQKGETDRALENLLTDSEEPLTREQIFSGLKTQFKVEGKTIASTNNAKVSPKAKNAVNTSKLASAENVKKPAVVKNSSGQQLLTYIPLPNDKPTKAMAKQLNQVAPATGVDNVSNQGFFVQLGSLRSEEAAQLAWKDLQKSLSVLRALDHDVERADLGERGVYYRLKAGPYSEAKARDICASVKVQRPGGCLVIKN